MSRTQVALHEELDLGIEGPSTKAQQYDPVPMITEVRRELSRWRALPVEQSGVTPITARLLRHWREYPFENTRPFFCQIEAIETAIWLFEVAGVTKAKGPAEYRKIRQYLLSANQTAHTDLLRIALKMATGSGKTSVMAMMIAWQTLNAARQSRKSSSMFSKGFLIVTPGITIKDRLRVLQPNDPDNYYQKHNLVPVDMLAELGKANIVITNFHSFEHRTHTKLTKTTRALLQGHEEDLGTRENADQMLKRVCNSLIHLENIIVINDEAHHCYREKNDGSEEQIHSADKAESEKNRKAARLWMTGLESVHRQIGVKSVFDLSATPYFLSGSGYAEGTLFPWTMSDFSLLDAIESGIVKLPRVPVADNVQLEEMPVFRELWKHIGKAMPKSGRRKTSTLDPLSLPNQLQGAIEALYGHYERVFEAWKSADIEMHPVFIVVCNNTATSKLVYDYIAGFERSNGEIPHLGRLKLFRNYRDDGSRRARPRTILIDSEQLEAGDALDKNFRTVAFDEIERFRHDLVERSGDVAVGAHFSDAQLLREAMNTVGKKGRLGESIRCVVSVAMLSEGWDANTVTHVLGVRAFGTQLLCEQVVGRSLRRQSYELGEDGLFDVEYADVLGIPFDFTAEPVVVRPIKPKRVIQVHAVRPERDHLEISFPRVDGYSIELPSERLEATFDENSYLELTPELVGPTQTHNEGILGEGVVLTRDSIATVRKATLAFYLAKHLLVHHFKGSNNAPKFHLLGDLIRIAREWLEGGFLICKGNTIPSQILYTTVADEACNRIEKAVVRSFSTQKHVRVILDAYCQIGSTMAVDFSTTKEKHWRTHEAKSHVNYAICDSDWELEFCRVLERFPPVVSYVKNHCLGFEIPYRMKTVTKRYRPDFIVRIDDGGEDLVNLIVEVKGYRGEDAKIKSDTVQSFWIPGVNHTIQFGRWSFLELTDVHTMEYSIRNWFKQNAASEEVRTARWLTNTEAHGLNLESTPQGCSELPE